MLCCNSGVAKGGHGRAFAQPSQFLAQPSQTFAQPSQVASLKFTRGFTAAHKTTLFNTVKCKNVPHLLNHDFEEARG